MLILGIFSALLTTTSALWVLWLSTHDSNSRHQHFRGLAVLTSAGCILSVLTLVVNENSQRESSALIKDMAAEYDDVLGPSISFQTFGLRHEADGSVFVEALVHNAGQSTAFHVHALIVLVNTVPGGPKPDFAHAYSEGESHGEGPIGKDSSEVLRTEGTVPRAVIDRQRALGADIYALGSVWYDDGRHRKHELAFCYVLNKDENFEVRQARSCRSQVS